MSVLRGLALTVVGAAALATALPAASNGDTFFNTREIPGNPQYVVFGSVRDVEGHYLKDVTVTVSVVKHMVELSAHTDVLGRYRTPDVGRSIQDLGYTVDPSLIIVSVDYPGYHIAHREYRGKYRQKLGAVEIDFRLAKN
jgi:hypothetical protein